MTKYRPENKTELLLFVNEFCSKCSEESRVRECDILRRALSYRAYHKEYPVEWCYSVYSEESSKGIPIDMAPKCTAFKKIAVRLAAVGKSKKGGGFETRT